MRKKYVTVMLALIASIAVLMILADATYAKRPDKDIRIVAKKVKGKVSGIGMGFISLVYKEEEKMQDKERQFYARSIAFRVDENTTVENKEFSEIQRGDIVEIKYDENREVLGSEDKLVNRIARIIKFLKPMSAESTLVGKDYLEPTEVKAGAGK